MTDQELLLEALRLDGQEDHAGALPLWERLRSIACDIDSRCLYLLNERKCLSAIGNHHGAQQRLQLITEIDSAGQYKLHAESALIDDLYRQGRFLEATNLSKQFLKNHAAELIDPRFADIVYEEKLALACGLVSANDFEAGEKALSEVLPQADVRDVRRVRYYRSLAYYHLGRFADAVNDLKALVDSNERDQWTASGHYSLGQIYYSTESFTPAKHHFLAARAMKEFLSERDLYVALSWVCKSLGEINEAKMYARLAKSIPELKI